ncbi:MAG: O-antigen ligase family protein [Chloroflexi bacterium]|nr:O-antigen ligase family protein [Chloroflexota bacterium]
MPRLDLALGVAAGALVGLSLIALGPLLTVGVVLVLIYVVILVKAPELPILAILVFSSGLLPRYLNRFVNLGVGNFQISDLILLSLLGLTGFRIFAERGFTFRKTPLDLPVMLYCFAVIFGMYTAVSQYGIEFSYTTYEARIMLSYSIFFVITQLLRTPQQIKRLVIGIAIIGLTVSTLLLLQVTTGFTIPFIPSLYFRADRLSRAYHPGFYAVFITMMMLVCYQSTHKSNLRTLALWLAVFMLGLSITISLGRNIVFSTLIALAMLGILLQGKERRRLALLILAIILVAASLFAVLKVLSPNSALLAYPRALMGRLFNLVETNPLSPDETLLWRVEETNYAWQHIQEHPLVGIGLFNPYRPVFFIGDTLQTYIHNGYLWVWLKTGLLGFIPFVVFIFGFILHGFLKWRSVQDPFLRAIALGAPLIIFAMTFSNTVAPIFIEGFNLAFFAATIGIGESILALKEDTQ